MKNNFSFTKVKGSTDPEKVVLTLTDVADKVIMPKLREVFTIPILQGERNELASGQIEYRFEIPQPDAERLRAALMHVYTNISGFNTLN